MLKCSGSSAKRILIKTNPMENRLSLKNPAPKSEKNQLFEVLWHRIIRYNSHPGQINLVVLCLAQELRGDLKTELGEWQGAEKKPSDSFAVGFCGWVEFFLLFFFFACVGCVCRLLFNYFRHLPWRDKSENPAESGRSKTGGRLHRCKTPEDIVSCPSLLL